MSHASVIDITCCDVKMWSSIKQLSKSLIKNSITTNFISQSIKGASTLPNEAYKIEERKIEVDGVHINYVRTGVGEHPVLLLPGAMGTIWTDFKPQIDHLNKEKLTVVAWDPPGCGKSRPPDRSFSENFFERDAFFACNLMKTLGLDKFSLLGWSDGGITALILAATYPKNVRKLIVTGANSYIAPKEIDIYNKIRNIDSWSERMRVPFLNVYGEEYCRRIWNDWINAMRIIYEKKNGDICKSALSKIICQTLIVHGQKDPMVLEEHPIYLKENIKNSRLEIFKDGAHNLHLRYANEFNELVNDFL